MAAYRFSSVYRGIQRGSTHAALKSAIKMILASLCGLAVIQYGLRPHAWPELLRLILKSLFGRPKLFGYALGMVWPSRCVEPCAREKRRRRLDRYRVRRWRRILVSSLHLLRAGSSSIGQHAPHSLIKWPKPRLGNQAVLETRCARSAVCCGGSCEKN
ncbi:hypothetical protein FUT89_09585 [Ralstonia pseudosolanacearum]|nr:hypothetical protein RSOE_06485 [Ralstonia solanacearum OE1-1]TXD92993.1 hypothetical protein FUT89_09585 [Ralstonia pseudosolanacearum]